MAHRVPRPESDNGPFVRARPGPLDDLYHYLLTAPWPELIAFVALFFVAANLVFATGYYLDGGIENTHSGSFLDMFFFSIQTMATIGYGKMAPISLFCNVLVSIEALFGLLGLAMVTGLVFSKFSRPTARVRFSSCAIVAPREGVPSLMFRMANLRNNRIVEGEIHVVVARQENTLEGESVRRFHDLAMSRSRSALFQLTWTAIHPIVENSPLHGHTRESLARCEGEILVSLIGFDETFSQTVHARHSYRFDQIEWGVRFLDVLKRQPDGRLKVDYAHFDEVEPLQSGKP
ncbi:MAG: ion channel [Candidatus Binatus sp.]|uniref:ion channel n=1 Tax=Candidatus Binatus sp. TaxID=2811406 RepID=UPI00271CA86B|nr:ion channel [Candidatus Binatus sp.]MDO8433239.1 ion channel [Candidatus Binatus sp.]